MRWRRSRASWSKTRCWASSRASSARPSADFQQLHVEHQRRARRDDAAAALLAVGELRRNGELAHAADAHALHALVEALDDVARAEREVERVAPVAAGIELGAVQQLADVVHHDVAAC